MGVGNGHTQFPPRMFLDSMPGVVAEEFCGHCGSDLGVKPCAGGCCAKRHADLLPDICTGMDHEADHGCCIHDEPSSTEAVPSPSSKSQE